MADEEETVRVGCRDVSSSSLSPRVDDGEQQEQEHNNIIAFLSAYRALSENAGVRSNSSEDHDHDDLQNPSPTIEDSTALNSMDLISSDSLVSDAESSDSEDATSNADSAENQMRPNASLRGRSYLPLHTNYSSITSFGRSITGVRHPTIAPNTGMIYERTVDWSSFRTHSPILAQSVDRHSISRGLNSPFFSMDDNDSTFPPRIRYGNRSFLPKAKFDGAPKAYPAKPDILGFSPCHEKALAACSVYQSVQNENSDDEDLTSNADIFSHFWMETNVVRWEDEPQSVASEVPAVENPTTVSNTEPEANADTEVDPRYQQWDNETSIINNPLNYDLWNEMTGEIRGSQSQLNPRREVDSRQNGRTTATTTVGVGTDSLDEDERTSRLDRGPVIIERIGPNHATNSNRCLSPQTREFYHTIGLVHDAGDGNIDGRSLFILDRPLMREEIATQIPHDQVPRSFLHEANSGGDSTQNISLGSDGPNSGFDEKAGIAENDESVFPRPREFDNTPMNFWNELGAIMEVKTTEHINNLADEYFLSFSKDPDATSVLPSVCDNDKDIENAVDYRKIKLRTYHNVGVPAIEL